MFEIIGVKETINPSQKESVDYIQDIFHRLTCLDEEINKLKLAKKNELIEYERKRKLGMRPSPVRSYPIAGLGAVSELYDQVILELMTNDIKHNRTNASLVQDHKGKKEGLLHEAKRRISEELALKKDLIDHEKSLLGQSSSYLESLASGDFEGSAALERDRLQELESIKNRIQECDNNISTLKQAEELLQQGINTYSEMAKAIDKQLYQHSYDERKKHFDEVLVILKDDYTELNELAWKLWGKDEKKYLHRVELLELTCANKEVRKVQELHAMQHAAIAGTLNRLYP